MDNQEPTTSTAVMDSLSDVELSDSEFDFDDFNMDLLDGEKPKVPMPNIRFRARRVSDSESDDEANPPSRYGAFYPSWKYLNSHSSQHFNISKAVNVLLEWRNFLNRQGKMDVNTPAQDQPCSSSSLSPPVTTSILPKTTFSITTTNTNGIESTVYLGNPTFHQSNEPGPLHTVLSDSKKLNSSMTKSTDEPVPETVTKAIETITNPNSIHSMTTRRRTPRVPPIFQSGDYINPVRKATKPSLLVQVLKKGLAKKTKAEGGLATETKTEVQLPPRKAKEEIEDEELLEFLNEIDKRNAVKWSEEVRLYQESQYRKGLILGQARQLRGLPQRSTRPQLCLPAPPSSSASGNTGNSTSGALKKVFIDEEWRKNFLERLHTKRRPVGRPNKGYKRAEAQFNKVPKTKKISFEKFLENHPTCSYNKHAAIDRLKSGEEGSEPPRKKRKKVAKKVKPTKKKKTPVAKKKIRPKPGSKTGTEAASKKPLISPSQRTMVNSHSESEWDEDFEDEMDLFLGKKSKKRTYSKAVLEKLLFGSEDEDGSSEDESPVVKKPKKTHNLSSSSSGEDISDCDSEYVRDILKDSICSTLLSDLSEDSEGEDGNNAKTTEQTPTLLPVPNPVPDFEFLKPAPPTKKKIVIPSSKLKETNPHFLEQPSHSRNNPPPTKLVTDFEFLKPAPPARFKTRKQSPSLKENKSKLPEFGNDVFKILEFTKCSDLVLSDFEDSDDEDSDSEDSVRHTTKNVKPSTSRVPAPESPDLKAILRETIYDLDPLSDFESDSDEDMETVTAVIAPKAPSPLIRDEPTEAPSSHGPLPFDIMNIFSEGFDLPDSPELHISNSNDVEITSSNESTVCVPNEPIETAVHVSDNSIDYTANVRVLVGKNPAQEMDSLSEDVSEISNSCIEFGIQIPNNSVENILQIPDNVTHCSDMVPDNLVENDTGDIKVDIKVEADTKDGIILAENPDRQLALMDEPVQLALMDVPVQLALMDDETVQLALMDEPVQLALMDEPVQLALTDEPVQVALMNEPVDPTAPGPRVRNFVYALRRKILEIKKRSRYVLVDTPKPKCPQSGLDKAEEAWTDLSREKLHVLTGLNISRLDEILKDYDPSIGKHPDDVEIQPSYIRGKNPTLMTGRIPLEMCRPGVSHSLSLLRKYCASKAPITKSNRLVVFHSRMGITDRKRENGEFLSRSRQNRNPENCAQPGDLMFKFTFYHTHNQDIEFEDQWKLPSDSREKDTKPAFTMETFGRVKLSSIRERFVCFHDCISAVESDFIHERRLPIENMAYHRNPRWVLRVDDTLYCDFNIKESVEGAQRVIDYYAKGAYKMAVKPYPTQIKDANTTSLADMNLRFGYPYIYTHQDGCEHVVVFNQAWLYPDVHPTETQESFPNYTVISKPKPIRCYMEDTKLASWVVSNCKSFGIGNAFLCTDCARSLMFHQKEANNLVFKYKADLTAKFHQFAQFLVNAPYYLFKLKNETKSKLNPKKKKKVLKRTKTSNSEMLKLRRNQSRSKIRQTELVEAKLEKTKVAKAKREEAKLAKAKPTKVKHEEDMLAEANREEAKHSRAKLAKAKREEAKPSKAKLAEAKREEAKLAEAKREEAKLAEAKREEAKLAKAKREEAKPSKAKLAEAKREEAKLAEAKREEAKLAEAKREEAKLAEAKREEAKLAEAMYEEAKLAKPKPAKAKREEAKLAKDKRGEAKLSRAMFAESKREEAKPLKAKLAEAKREEAKLAKPKRKEDKLVESAPQEPKRPRSQRLKAIREKPEVKVEVKVEIKEEENVPPVSRALMKRTMKLLQQADKWKRENLLSEMESYPEEYTFPFLM